MTKARTLADFISDGSPLADGTISVSEVSGAAPLASPTFTGNIDAGDNVKLRLGNSDDLQIYHDGFNSYIADVGTGDLKIQGANVRLENPSGVRYFQGSSGNAYLYNSGDIKLATTATGIDVTGDATFADNGKAIFGAGSDLQIYHDGFNSFIVDQGTGDLAFRGSALIGFQNSAGTENYANFNDNGAVNLYHNNSLQFATTSTGVDITGEVKADKFTNDEALPTVRPSLLLDFANSKTLDPRITFTRGSTATYWDGHTTTKAEENLAYPSQGFTALSSTRFTQENNTSPAPDGTNTATEIRETSITEFHDAYTHTVSFAGETTVSAYVKPIGRQYLYIYVNTGNNSRVFDIVNGTVEAGHYISGPQTAGSITDAGNGWYRISITFTSTDPNRQVAFGPILSGGNFSSGFSGDTSKGFYIWGVQVETRSSATAYTPTTSSPIVKYQPTLQTASSGEARFDHDPVTGESKGFLIEEARTNLETRSAGSVSYVGQGTQRTNAAVAPDGTLTALECVPNTTSTTHVFDQYGNPVFGDMTFSLFVKANGYHKCLLEYQASGNGTTFSKFDLSTGTVTNNTNATGRIEEIGNGWYRISISMNITATGADIERFQILDDNGNTNFAGDGFSGMFIWGYQFEAGSFPTSYIPTSGSTVTRSQDKGEMDTAGWWSDNEGTLFTKTSAFHYDSASSSDIYRIFWVRNTSSGTYGDAYHHSHQKNGSMRVAVNSNGSNNVALQVTTGNTSANQIANLASSFYYDNSNGYTVAASGNGNTVQTDNSSNAAPLGLNKAYIGWHSDGTEMNGHIRKISFHPKRLSNATLQAMTEE